MIKTLTSYTSEIDSHEIATAEILKQLNIEKNLLKHSVGILNCHSEFVDSGIVEAICKELPFDVIGTTTLGNAVAGGLSQMQLSVTLLTSDDIIFSSAVTDPLKHDNYKDILGVAYNKAAEKLSGKPSLMLVFAPLLFDLAGDYIVESLDFISGGIPMFGTLAVDHTIDYSTAATIYNGKTNKNRLSLILMHGDINPIFSIASVAEEKILGQKAIVTESEGNILKGVNGMSVIKYLQSIGLAPNGKIEGLNAIPFIIDFNDGTKTVTRAIFAITPEGHAVCGGVIPVNATLGIGYIDHDDVLSTTKYIISKILEQKRHDGLFIFSCLVRNLVLGFDVFAEMQEVHDGIKEEIPFFMSYSGGEICPVCDEEGRLVNRFHNDTIVTCLI
ncbi:MAG: FIST C-terminal domain-containing protein [Endomicrobium sp.]|nr:FIST C-terminal domain-containing protein [Endomicrobium sp.]